MLSWCLSGLLQLTCQGDWMCHPEQLTDISGKPMGPGETKSEKKLETFTVNKNGCGLLCESTTGLEECPNWYQIRRMDARRR